MEYEQVVVYSEYEMEKVNIRYATLDDGTWIRNNDHHLRDDLISRKISSKEVLLAVMDGVPVGMLRYCLLWDNTPFMNMLFVLDGHQRKGIGLKLVAVWEENMAADGYRFVMTSTQVDETAQHFYRKIGYRDCGSLLYPGQSPLEMILVKDFG